MTDLTLGILIGAGGMFVAWIALLLLLNHGPGSPDWEDFDNE